MLTQLQSDIKASESEQEKCKAQLSTRDNMISKLQAEIKASESERRDLESALAALESERNALRSERDSLQSQLASGNKQLQELRTTYENLLKDIQTPQLKNPTWQELKRFIEEDRTDALRYIPGEFDCEGFAITFRDAAARRGFRCALVSIGFEEGSVGHALNAFQTDRGRIYVDVTERDSIAYVEKGKPYGKIVLEGVRETYIDCAYTTPNAFWHQPLRYTRYGGNLFAYEYYRNYSARWEFYSQSIAAYKDEVQAYKAAAEEFIRGTGPYSYAQLNEWYDRLEAWAENLDALEEDLGGLQIETIGTVDTIETYWN